MNDNQRFTCTVQLLAQQIARYANTLDDLAATAQKPQPFSVPDMRLDDFFGLWTFLMGQVQPTENLSKVKIACIKEIRRLYPELGLKDAKILIDLYFAFFDFTSSAGNTFDRANRVATFREHFNV